MTKRTMFVLLLVVACILWIGVRWLNSRSRPLHTLGVANGQLADCPSYTNCVSTQANDPEHHSNPIPFTQPAQEAQRQLEAVIRSMPRSRIVTSHTGYIHAEFSSLLFGFVDDVELAIDAKALLIEFRSASRVGRSDLGVNRERMEQIRLRFQNR